MSTHGIQVGIDKLNTGGNLPKEYLRMDASHPGDRGTHILISASKADAKETRDHHLPDGPPVLKTDWL